MIGGRTKKMLEEIAEKYDLKAELPDLSDPSVIEEVTAGVINKCIPELEAYDVAERASYQLAWQIWT